jgi:hypothetical protein
VGSPLPASPSLGLPAARYFQFTYPLIQPMQNLRYIEDTNGEH